MKYGGTLFATCLAYNNSVADSLFGLPVNIFGVWNEITSDVV